MLRSRRLRPAARRRPVGDRDADRAGRRPGGVRLVAHAGRLPAAPRRRRGQPRGGGGPEGTDFVVHTLRLPRGLVGLLVGGAFGLSGAIFQRLARNPLASPDIIGVNAGAAAGAVLVIVLLHGSSAQVTWGALVGGTGAATAIYLLSYKRGVTGYRLVLVGIGATAMLTSATSYLMTRAEINDAQRAMVWLTGSLNGRGWDHVRPLVAALAPLVPVAVLLARHLRTLDLGDDAAAGWAPGSSRCAAACCSPPWRWRRWRCPRPGPSRSSRWWSPQIARRLVGAGSAALCPARWAPCCWWRPT